MMFRFIDYVFAVLVFVAFTFYIAYRYEKSEKEDAIIKSKVEVKNAESNDFTDDMKMLKSEAKKRQHKKDSYEINNTIGYHTLIVK